jgi:ribosomal protein S26
MTLQIGITNSPGREPCSSCGFKFPEHDACIGMSLQLSVPDDASGELMASMESQYAPYKLGKRYLVCWPCWLRSMGVNP